MKSPIFRNIVELSCMSNNDEVIFYTNKLIDPKHDELKFGKMVVSRPVFDIEIAEGLEISKKTKKSFDEKPPKITQFFDVLFEMKITLNWWREIHEKAGEVIDIEKMKTFFLNRYAMHYYDCMSGGMKAYEGAIIRDFIKLAGIDLNTELYPSTDEEGWHTVKDFLKSLENMPDLSDIKDKLSSNMLPSISMLLESPAGEEKSGKA